MHATHGARKIDALDALMFALSARRENVHTTASSRGEANRQYDAATEYLKGEHANMEQALRTTIEIELGHSGEPIKTMLGGQTYGKAPVVRIECVHEGIADDDEHAALWHDDAVTAATQGARVLLEGIGLAPKATKSLLVGGTGVTGRFADALAAAERAARARVTEPPNELDVTQSGASDAEHPRYIDDELEGIAIEVGCAMFGDGYRSWLEGNDEYAVAMRQRGAGAVRYSTLYADAQEVR